MNFIQITETFFISAIVAYLFTPFIRAMAIKLNYFDHPKDNKVHAHPTPLLGGVAIFLAFVISALAMKELISVYKIQSLLGGCFILLVIGLIDDKMGMMPNFKLLGQFLAAMIVVKSGVRIEFLNNYYANIVITYVWIMGITNSFNLLDNMNGLSAGMAAIAAIFFGAISYMNSQSLISAISFALAGSSLGFLRHNFPKAKIFMGDAGSMILGYVLSILAIMCSWKSYILATSLAIPLLILGYPIFDTALVTIIRIREGRSIFQGGKDHSSHRLALLGLKRYKAVLLIYLICVLLGIASIVVSLSHWTIGITLIVLTFVSMVILGIGLSFVDTKRFGRKKPRDA